MKKVLKKETKTKIKIATKLPKKRVNILLNFMYLKKKCLSNGSIQSI